MNSLIISKYLTDQLDRIRFHSLSKELYALRPCERSLDVYVPPTKSRSFVSWVLAADTSALKTLALEANGMDKRVAGALCVTARTLDSFRLKVHSYLLDPYFMEAMSNLTSLTLDHRGAHGAPLTRMPNLKRLSLTCESIHISSLPPDLTHLSLNAKSISEYTVESIQPLTKLESLHLHHCGMKFIPDEFAGLVALTTLDMSHNELSGYTEDGTYHNDTFTSIITLPNLKILNVSHNALDALMLNELSLLETTCLEELDVSHNLLPLHLPSHGAYCGRLKRLKTSFMPCRVMLDALPRLETLVLSTHPDGDEDDDDAGEYRTLITTHGPLSIYSESDTVPTSLFTDLLESLRPLDRDDDTRA